jgi:excisionase family DNA binding protein
MVVAERELVVTPKEQAPFEDNEAERTFDELRDDLQVLRGDRGSAVTQARLVSPDGKTVIELPPHVFHALRFVAHNMARGNAISLTPMHKQLSTQQAAEILNVSRPFLVKLLDQGAIPHIKVGTHRRVRMRDVIRYKKQRDRQMLDMLEQLANEAQEAGDYFGE